MPSRKGQSSDDYSTNRRSSLRRLSSIASLHSLNPFARRRSNNATDPTTPLSSSTVSTSSATAAASERSKDFSLRHNIDNPDQRTIGPPPPSNNVLPTRRSSHAYLPDDRIGGIPRSRTFSNLPLPNRTRRTNTSLAPSQSYVRLPSALLPPTRLPSPMLSTRQHSSTRLTVKDGNARPTREKLFRSDTEPLLQAGGNQQSELPRSTAFKENISLSPIKPLSAMDLLGNENSLGNSWQSSAYVGGPGWCSPSNRDESLSRITTNLSTRFEHPETQVSTPKRYSHPSGRSPKVFRSAKDRPPTPGGNIRPEPVQRWNSQPVLTNATNNRTSREIKQSRLMSARQAPTPPPAKTPLTVGTLTSGKLNISINSGCPWKTAEGSSPPLSSPTRPKISEPLKPDTQAVTTAQPFAYWTGRFSALNDRYRNDDFSERPVGSTPSVKSLQCRSENNTLRQSEATENRMRRAVEHLYALCTTNEARQSFLHWQNQLAIALDTPELGRPVDKCVLDVGVQTGQDESPYTLVEKSAAALNATRKTSFMDRLLGRHRKSLPSGR